MNTDFNAANSDNRIVFQGRLTGGSHASSREYFAVEKIGQGGNAEVYSAWYDDGTGDKRPNAIIKKLRPVVQGMITEDDEQGSVCLRVNGTKYSDSARRGREIMTIRREAFLNEAREMRQYQALAICAGLLEVFEYRNTLCVAMQRSGGETLLSEMRSADYTPDPATLLEDIKEILGLVATVHADGKLHMDISPDNLYRQPSGNIILLDFGSVSPANRPLGYHSIKKGYSAPEVERCNQFGYEADIYSIGAVLYRALFGCEYDWRAFDAADFDGLDDLPINDGCREQLRAILGKSLSFTPETRYHSTDEFAAAIDEYLRLHNQYGVSRIRLMMRSEDELRSKGVKLCGDTSIISLESENGGALIAEKALKWLRESRDNVLLYGAGGKGKTTLLHMVWNDMLEELRIRTANGRSAPVPLYISLTGYPKSDDWRGGDDSESYIVRQLCVNLLGAPSIRACTPEQMTGLWDELSRVSDSDSSAPRYVIIADALDEVSASSRSHAIKELNRAAALPGVRVIVTSRRADIALDDFKAISLPDIDDSRIDRYMKKHGASKNALGHIRANHELYTMLRRPLYLNLAGQMVECGDQEQLIGITSGVELMDHYYRGFEATKLSRVTAGMESVEQQLALFAYERILPMFAFRMEQINRRYSVDRAELRALMKRAFKEFASEDFLAVQYKYANAINYYNSLDAAGRMAVGNRLLSLLVNTLCMINENGECYEFTNRHISGYFAARHLLNRLQLALDAGSRREYSLKILRKICSQPWRTDIAHNAYLLAKSNRTNGRDLLQRALDLLRGETGHRAGRCVANIISALMADKQGLAGMSLRDLDLTACDLVGINCIGADFAGATLSDNVFMGLSRNLSIVINASDQSRVYIISDEDDILCVDTATGSTRSGTLDSGMELYIRGYECNDRLFVLGRITDQDSLALAIYNTDDIGSEQCASPAQYIEIPSDSLLRDGVLRGLITDFSPDGKYLLLTRTPEPEDVESTIVLIDIENALTNCCIFRGGCFRARLRCDHSLYLIYDDFRAYMVRFDSQLVMLGSTRIECDYAIYDILCSRDGLSDTLLIKDNGKVCIAYGDGRVTHLRLPHSLENAGGEIFELCDLEDCCAVAIRTRNEQSDFIMPDDGSSAVMISGRILAPTTKNSVLTRLTEDREEYIGIYNFVRDSWDFRIRNSRGMQEVSVNGRYMLASRDNLVVLCDMYSGIFHAHQMECGDSKGTHWWLSEDTRSIFLTRAGKQIQLNYYELDGGYSTLCQPIWSRDINRDTLGIEQKVTLSVLNVSPTLDRLLIYCTCGEHKRFFIYQTHSGTAAELPLAESTFKVTMGQFIPGGGVAILGESNGRDILQLIGTENSSILIDVSFARNSESSLDMLCSPDGIQLVTYGKLPSDCSGTQDGAAIVRTLSYSGISSPDSSPCVIECSCINNARVSCWYMSGNTLLLKDRFVDKHFLAAHLNGNSYEMNTLYVDGMMVCGCNLRDAHGLSAELKELLLLAGANL